MFFGNSRKKLFKISWLDCEQYGENKRKRNTINIVRSSTQFTDPLIIPLIFIFLPCHEKAHDSKESSRENSKPRRESRTLNNDIIKMMHLSL